VKNYSELTVKAINAFASYELGIGYYKYLPELRPEKFLLEKKENIIPPDWLPEGDFCKMPDIKFNKKTVLYNQSQDAVIFWGENSWLVEKKDVFLAYTQEAGVFRRKKGSVRKFRKFVINSSIG
jgi:hypothetical protein